jgi:2,3-bisphosphoglycerate-independent phosphoglycerate mutase
LGAPDPDSNPLAAGRYPFLMQMTDGVALTAEAGRLRTAMADMIPLDAQMCITGRPQSATGQAALLTGINAPAAIGEHYGPRPNDAIRALVRNDNLFSVVQEIGLDSGFCNAYPPGFFAEVERGKRLLSVIQYAAESAGLRLHDVADLEAGRALSSDYTNRGWREQLGYEGVPVYGAEEAGVLFWQLSQPNAFTLHDHWMTDVLGHHQDLDKAVEDFEVFDHFLGGLVSVADLDNSLIVIASDHGNVEDCSHGKHTLNPALCMLIGNRDGLPVDSMQSLSDLAPVILQFLDVANS